jgi:hypothetical protein
MPASKLPRAEEIVKLPRWAKVAFAARCVRRVQPLLGSTWPEAPEKYIEAIEMAITLAEHVAAVGAASDADAGKFATADADRTLAATGASVAMAANPAIADDARFAAAAARFAIAAVIAADCADAATEAAAESAAADADAAVRGSYAASDDYAAAAMYADQASGNAAATAAASYATFAAGFNSLQREVLSRQIRDDFDLLFQKAISEGWADQTPVLPTMFGPMCRG